MPGTGAARQSWETRAPPPPPALALEGNTGVMTVTRSRDGSKVRARPGRTRPEVKDIAVLITAVSGLITAVGGVAVALLR